MFLRKENEISSFNKSLGMLFFFSEEKNLKEKESLKMEHLSWKWWKIADLWCVYWQLGNWAKLVPLKRQRMETEKGDRQEHVSGNDRSQQPSRFCIFPSSPWKTSWWNRARDEYQIQTLGFKNKMATEGLSSLNLEWKRCASSSGYSSWWTPHSLLHPLSKFSRSSTNSFLPEPGDSAALYQEGLVLNSDSFSITVLDKKQKQTDKHNLSLALVSSSVTRRELWDITYSISKLFIILFWGRVSVTQARPKLVM